MNLMNQTYKRTVQALLSRHGYQFFFAGGKVRLREMAIAGFTSERLLPDQFGSLTGAIDYLLPLLGAEFSEDYHRTFPQL